MNNQHLSFLPEILHDTFLENSLLRYCLFFAIILFGLLFKRFLSRKLSILFFMFFRKISNGVGADKFLVLLAKPIDVFLLLITFYIAFDQLEFPSRWRMVTVDHFGVRMVMIHAFQIAITISITWMIMRIIDFMALVFHAKTNAVGVKTDLQLIPFAKEAAKILLVIFSIFFVLGAIFSLNIGSLIAGLGIGGLAIALAAKETLENLLGSFTIFLDKPFVVGDTVKVGAITGTVERIGFRSTRLRTPDKTYLTVPNKKMVDVELDNISLRTQRRVAFNIGLTYTTSIQNIQEIVREIKVVIEDHKHTTDGKVRFSELGENSLNIMVQFFMDIIEDDVYLATKEEINYRIMEIVRSHGCHFSTKTIYLQSKSE
jgi:MscS family membrane protein